MPYRNVRTCAAQLIPRYAIHAYARHARAYRIRYLGIGFVRRRAAAMEDDTTLSHRAKLFRSKLIEDFQLLEFTSEEGRRKAPVYTSADIMSS